MSNFRRFRRHGRPPTPEIAPGDPNEPAQARALRLAAHKLRHESPAQYRAIRIIAAACVLLAVAPILVGVVIGLVRLAQYLL
jgi:hypothetical protein